MIIAKYDVVIIGAGAAGLMSAVTAARLGKKVLLLEHTDKIGEKIRISGGGRCNFTNINVSSNNFLSKNIHFVKSPLTKYTPQDFIKLVESFNISYHEKTLGQLFCDQSSKQIIAMFLELCARSQVEIKTSCAIRNIKKNESFLIETSSGIFSSIRLIIATGGLSIPKMGASDFGYKVAKQFGLKMVKPRPALVPLIVQESDMSFFNELRGITNYSGVSYGKTRFEESILFTHKGLSGPAILQISSYLEKFSGNEIMIDLLPHLNLRSELIKVKHHKQTLSNYLKNHLTNRLVDRFADINNDFNISITELSNAKLLKAAESLHNFKVSIADSEGYSKAEVTGGGISTDELSDKNMECKKVPGLHFVGEAVDVTGWLGGYNFQWAWSSGFIAGSSL